MTSSLDKLSPVWSHLTQVQPVRGEGAYLYDEAGTQYTDFTCGIGVTNTGHCHPKVVKAIQDQAAKLIFGQMNIVITPQAIALADALDTVTPSSINNFFFSNSGAEAVEGAVKLARHATNRRHVIVFQGSFHGRTAQTMAMSTSKTVYRYNYQPLPSGIFVAPFPYSYFYGMDEDATIEFCMKQLDLLLHTQTAPEETAAIIIEPVLGEGGYVPAPAKFLQQLRELCTQYGILLITDEIQTGFGRTGKFFAAEHAGIEPDIMVMAKGLGSGMPISAIGSRRELMEKWVVGTHGGTYAGGNAIAMAAAKASVEVIKDENLPQNAANMGNYLMGRLKELQAEFPIIGDVRGRGLMVGTEFTTADGQPDPDTTKAILSKCLSDRLLLLSCGSYANVIRWIPPLIVNQEQIDAGVSIFANALQSVIGEKARS